MKVFFKKLLCCTLAILMLLTMLAACGKEEEETTEEESYADTDEELVDTAKLNAAYSETVFSCFDDYSVSTITYNGYNNPISEKIVGIDEVDGYLDVDYEYNDFGLLTKVTANYYYYDGDNAEKEQYFSVDYVVEDREYKSVTVYNGDNKVDSTLSSEVTYHEDGTIKKLWIGASAENSEWTIEQDASGRRTLFSDGYIYNTLTYSDESRDAKNGEIGYKRSDNKETVQFEYASGVISKITVKDADEASDESTVYELNFFDGTKWLHKAMCYYYEGTEIDEQQSWEFAYTDLGMFELLIWTVYENGASIGGEMGEFEYTDGHMTKSTFSNFDAEGKKSVYYISEYEYDSNGNNTKAIEKDYNENGAIEEISTVVYEYDTNGNLIQATGTVTDKNGNTESSYSTTYAYNDAKDVTKVTRFSYNGDGSFKSHTENEYEYDDKGLKSKNVYSGYNEDGSIIGRDETVYDREYDSNGKLIKAISTETSYDSQGKITDKFQSITEYNNGSRVKYTSSYYENSDNYNEITRQEIYEYDDKGNKTKDTSWRYWYDWNNQLKGKIEDITEYGSNKEIVKETTVYYEDLQDLTKPTSMRIHTYEYDENGNKIKTIGKIDGLGGNTATYTSFIGEYEYSKFDDGYERTKDTQTFYEYDGTVSYKEVREYEYDSNGRRTKEKYTRYDSDGNIEEERVDNY